MEPAERFWRQGPSVGAQPSAQPQVTRGASLAGGLRGPRRLARHLWRMCVALFVATGSFFLGQADEFPEPLRILPLLLTLAFAPLVLMLYWLWRVRVRQAFRGLAGAHVPPRVPLRTSASNQP